MVALERPDERLGHAVRLRAFDQRGAGHEADIASEAAGVVGGVTTVVVGQPLDRAGERIHWPEAVFDTEHHEHRRR